MEQDTMPVTTGIDYLDRLLGGLRIGDNVVWYDDAGSLSAVFYLNFILAAQARAKPLIYVSFDRSPKNLLDKLSLLGDSAHLTILDCFTFGKGAGIVNFYSHSCPRLYELNTVAYWIIEKQAHTQRLRARINQIAQVAIDLSVRNGCRPTDLVENQMNRRKSDRSSVSRRI